jgi:hypothetical protein
MSMGRIVGNEACPKCRARGHDSRGDNLNRYDDGGGHCFACGYHIHAKRYIREVKKDASENTIALPRDFTREVPAEGWKWLLQYGLPYSYWKPYCGYSPAEDRLIFTVGNPIRFSIGRFIERKGIRVDEAQVPHRDASRLELSASRVPIVLPEGVLEGAPDRSGNPGEGVRIGPVPLPEPPRQVLPVRTREPRKWRLFGDRHGYAELLDNSDSGPDEGVVLVEDIISGHKVAQVAPSLCLFGVDLHTKAIQVLKASKRPVTLWLDEDQYRYLPKKINRLQTFLNVPVRFIRQRKDPKEYTLDEIKEILK